MTHILNHHGDLVGLQDSDNVRVFVDKAERTRQAWFVAIEHRDGKRTPLTSSYYTVGDANAARDLIIQGIARGDRVVSNRTVPGQHSEKELLLEGGTR